MRPHTRAMDSERAACVFVCGGAAVGNVQWHGAWPFAFGPELGETPSGMSHAPRNSMCLLVERRVRRVVQPAKLSGLKRYCHSSASAHLSPEMAQAEGSAQDAIERIKRLAAATNFYDKTAKTEASAACEAAKEMMRRSIRSFLDSVSGLPVLTSKGADGTPLSLVHRSKSSLAGAKDVRSVGKRSVELLLKNQFVRANVPTEGWVTKAMLTEAVPMTKGKSVPAIQAASFRDWFSLRGMRHFGCAVEHYCWDRLSIVALERLARQWHIHQPHNDLPAYLSPEVSRMTEFVVVTPCALHDAQNAFRWGFFSEVQERELMRDIYVGIESLRNSHDLLHSFVGEWVASRLSLHEGKPLEWQESQQAMWYALGLDPALAELLVNDLQLYFQRGRMWVWSAAAVAIDADVIDRITYAFKALMRYIKFTESRWLTVGSSARSLVASLMLGLIDLVEFIQKHANSGLWYLNGFTRLKKVGRISFLVRAAVSSRVAEAVQSLLLEDSRVASLYDEIWEAAAEELRWVVTLRAEV